MSTSFAFAGHIEEKSKYAGKNLLPSAGPALETPAPQRTKTSIDYGKYTPTQKASIVALKVAK
ncbi:hypothetical protein FEM33_21375 [Dyadobacter flavalbus]|uniref:Uncharacterized protein n=1 Tax=Dyadobacter flavalbus TaxID=2579942 RepID=A0A5M8QNE7_9BACT|nr:hypothetical protein FEM33_21375 [Dyadobacter flavalbus]